MNYLFYLDELEIEEPGGFAEIELSLKRDPVFHGMSFEASTANLQFYGIAAEYLMAAKAASGVRANVIFYAYATCDEYDYEELVSGRLNFGRYRDSCGTVCSVSMPVEQKSCAITLQARREQKVDIDSNMGVDGFTPLQQYAGLGIETDLPAHNLRVATEGYVSEDGDPISLDIFPPANTHDFTLRPTYSRELNASINESQLTPSVFAASDNGLNDPIISPVVLLQEEIDCFNGTFEYSVRLKGSYNFTYTGVDPITVVRLVVAKGEYPGSLTILHQQDLSFTAHSAVGTFDYTYTGSTDIPQGDGFYVYFRMTGDSAFPTVLGGSVTFDAETYVDIEGVRSCPTTQAELYMIHETLSRTTEAITNGCVRVKSSYYGRTDSEPFSFDEDGCGGLRAVTSGLKIRQAIEDNYFDSLKNLIEGLNAIDNIGYDVVDDPDRPSGQLMRIEAVDYFYQDQEVLRHAAVPDAENEIEEQKHYSRIEVGYKKWEVEQVNGLQEINSNRQYNTSIDTINSVLDITSTLVAGTYPIEVTRQQSFAESGGADTKYDNDTFIICLFRTGYLYSVLAVDQGNITNPQNIFSPSTIYNYRISPLRNLMRWYKTIAAGFASLSDSINKLFFGAGTGNLIASGMMTDPDCRLENADIQENQNLFVTHFANSVDYTPLWRNEKKTYEYDMSVKEYKQAKANPYGYLSVQCGSSEYLKYWIEEIKFKPNKGTATFSLRRKYES